MQIPKTTLLIVGGGVAAYLLWRQLEQSKRQQAAQAAYAAGAYKEVARTDKGLTVSFKYKGLETQATIPLSGALGQPYGPTLQPESLVRVMPPLKRSVPTAFSVSQTGRSAFEYPFAKKGRPLQRIFEQIGVG